MSMAATATGGGRHPRTPRPAAGHPPHLGHGRAAVAWRHVRVLRSVLHRLCRARPGQGRAAGKRFARASSPGRRRSSRRRSAACSSARSCSAMSPTATAGGRSSPGRCCGIRQHRHHGGADHRHGRLPVAADRRHRHWRRAGDDRHLSLRTDAEGHARPSFRDQPGDPVHASCRWWRCWRICWCPRRRSASTAGAGLC